MSKIPPNLATSTANLNRLYNCVSPGLFFFRLRIFFSIQEVVQIAWKLLRFVFPVQKTDKSAYQHFIKEHFSKKFFQFFLTESGFLGFRQCSITSDGQNRVLKDFFFWKIFQRKPYIYPKTKKNSEKFLPDRISARYVYQIKFTRYHLAKIYLAMSMFPNI